MEKNKKMNFFKKMYFSIFNIKKYDELSKEGLKRSIYYIMNLLLIVSILYSGIITFQMKKSINELKIYLEENLPTITYKEEKLYCEDENRVVLNDNLVKANFGGQIIIDTSSEREALLKEYEGETSIILTTEKYITIDSKGKVSEYSYKDIIEYYLGKDITSLNKEELLSTFDKISYTYYFAAYAISYWIANSIVVFMYDLVISLIAFCICKIKKITIKFSEVYAMGLYALTIPVWGYLAINFIPRNITLYLQSINMIIPIIYLSVAIYVSKWVTPEMVKKKKI